MSLVRRRPRGLLRLALRLPIWLYRLRLGWLLGRRFLQLTHTGRRSGRPRRTVLEVVGHDRPAQTYWVASAWGERADWYRNVAHNPLVTITIGARAFPAQAERLAEDDGAVVLHRYAQRHPRAFGEITRLVIGRPMQATAANCRELAQSVPIVALRAWPGSARSAQAGDRC